MRPSPRRKIPKNFCSAFPPSRNQFERYLSNHPERHDEIQCLRYADVFLHFCAGLQGSGGTATPQSAGIATGC